MSDSEHDQRRGEPQRTRTRIEKAKLDRLVVALALEQPWSRSPTSDLCAAVRRLHGITPKAAGRAVDRVLERGLITQVWSKRKVPATGMMSGGMMEYEYEGATWEEVDELADGST